MCGNVWVHRGDAEDGVDDVDDTDSNDGTVQ